MEMNEQLDIFFELILEAIGKVNKEYFVTAYHNIPFQEDILYAARRRLIIYDEGNVYKPGERVFAYEFYHELRKLLDWEREKVLNFMEGCSLQAEVKKHQMYSILKTMQNIEPLSRNFIPDFLLHTPGNDDIHAYVLELKASFGLLYKELLKDLCKLHEFLTKYHYERGVFIAICQSMETLEKILTSDYVLATLKKDISLEVSKKIQVVTKENYHTQTQYKPLSQIIY